MKTEKSKFNMHELFHINGEALTEVIKCAQPHLSETQADDLARSLVRKAFIAAATEAGRGALTNGILLGLALSFVPIFGLIPGVGLIFYNNRGISKIKKLEKTIRPEDDVKGYGNIRVYIQAQQSINRYITDQCWGRQPRLAL